MAPNSTIYRLRVALSDVDRGVYQDLDLRLARHPSETTEFLLTRVLAYCLNYEEGIELSGGGLSDAEEPAIRIYDAQRSPMTWIDIGTPSADRMHRASKACKRVVIFTQHDPQLLVRESERRNIHRLEHIEAYAVDPKMLRELGALTDRNAQWELTRSDGELYVKVADKTVSGVLTRIALGAQ